ncbi:SWI5-dependent HO expression protein 4 [Wickerhamomyces ciferrii]|uniref:SWI5-dependent HO expression protein 4 n=1 Tax=Wickerhamomyces ciferrii (strain ATCC 14091 / BCRC 22168 / CBS 111 / JCM 3599 / NBRC 0793 / NRRL Y-1031 F-60-10) TaxID=1206466 RepID=K0KRY3_WICCF|nr:SWI5-dependent HO expression protein 4 [Wickerhamomyces ciferrii]CCH44103.1 SWI5-dependent HO expression protein 4 [Wickerhamomyces ciferrii]
MSTLEELFSRSSIEELDVSVVKDQLNKSKGSSDLEKLILENVERAYELALKTDIPLALLLKGDRSKSEAIIQFLISKIKHTQSDSELEFVSDTLSLILSTKGFVIKDAEILVSCTIFKIVDLEKCWVSIIRLYKANPSETLVLIDQQLDILNAREQYAPIFKIVATIFEIDKEQGKALFQVEAVQESIVKVSQYSSQKVIKEGLNLLSALCSDDETRKLIASKFTSVLVEAVKYNDIEIQELSALVIIKTWNFTQLESEKSLNINDLYDILTKKFTKFTVEALAYLSIKPSIKQRIRSDDEVILDLTKLLDPKEGASLEDIYGALVTLANLSTIEEKSEVSELKQHAKKGLESEIEEDPEDIKQFQEDLLERNVIHNLSSHKKLSLTSVLPAIKLVYNLSKEKQNRPQVLSQAGLEIVIRSITLDNIPQEILKFAYQSISNLLLTTNPSTVFRLREAQFALFQYLSIDGITQKEQLQALISLTNANAVDNGAFTPIQWKIIDHYLNNEETAIRRAAIELVCNAVQHKENVAGLFDFSNKDSKRRYDLLVQYTGLPDLKSQNSAVAALSFGITIEFIAQEVIKDDKLLKNLSLILNEQYKEQDLLERTLYVLYYLVFHSEENSQIITSLSTNTQLKNGIEKVIRNTKRSTEPFEMALEITKIVRFK